MRFLLRTTLAAAFVGTFLVVPHAQRGGGARSGPAQPPLWLPDDQYLRWPLPTGAQVYAALDAHRLKGYSNEMPASAGKRRAAGEAQWEGVARRADGRAGAEAQ